MSGENVEVIRELWDAYARGDFDHVLALSDPYVVMVSVEEGPLYGQDAVRRNYERWIEAWDSPEISVEEIFGEGDQVFVTAHFRARGRASGVGKTPALRGLHAAQSQAHPRGRVQTEGASPRSRWAAGVGQRSALEAHHPV
jgi:ketosteroid isomerase-like protein